MGAFTTRLALYKPGGGLSGTIVPDEIADIDKINADLDAIDAAIGFRNVTSGTRPVAPYDGQSIYETDTTRIRIWNQTAGQWLAPGTERGVGTIYYAADLDGLAGITDFREGDLVHIDEGDYYLTRGDSGWVQITEAQFATTGIRDTAYAKAAGAYFVAGTARAYAGGQHWEPTATTPPVWINPSNRTTMARIATQSIGNGSSPPVTIAFDTTYSDNNAFTITAGKFVCKIAGKYWVTAQCEYGTNVTNTRWVMIRKALAAAPTVFTPVTTNPWTPQASSTNNGNSVSAPVDLAVGDVIDIGTMQTSGGSISVAYAAVDIVRL